jgi:aquaporin Z
MPVEETSTPHVARQLMAEFVGTAFLVIVAAGGDTIDATTGGQIGHVARYLAPGLIVVAMIWSLSAVSGAHINPAVTLAFTLRGVFPPLKATGYWIVQFAGGVAGALVLRLFFASSVAKGVTHPGVGVTAWQAAAWEMVITTILVVVIISTAAEKAVVGRNAALAVGFTVACCGLFSSPLTGASMNPARSFGPQVAAQMWDGAWIYFLGPFAGAILATIICVVLHDRRSGERQTAEGEQNAA